MFGGGDTGTDCVGTRCAMAAEPQQIEIMAMPPMDRAEDNPWPEWPKGYKAADGFGPARSARKKARRGIRSDPRCTDHARSSRMTAPAISPVVTVNIRWEKNDKGQFIPVEQPGSEKEHPAQLVLLAMGFLGPEQALLKDLKVETDARSNVKAEYGKYGTSVPRGSPPTRAGPTGGLGHQRRPRRRARVRPLPHGRHRTAGKPLLQGRPRAWRGAASFHQRPEVCLRLRRPDVLVLLAPAISGAPLRRPRAGRWSRAAHRDRRLRRNR